MTNVKGIPDGVSVVMPVLVCSDAAAVALAASAAHFVGAGVAGVIFGLVSDVAKKGAWLFIFLAVWVMWTIGPAVWIAHGVSIPLLRGLAFQACLGCLAAAGGFWLGRRLRGPEPVA